MSQVPVKWCRTDLMTDHQLHYANGDPMGKQIPVVPLDALREAIEKMCDDAIANMDAARQASCSCYFDGLNTLLASLGEQ